ncbi:MAG: hypothetical protein ACREMX_04460, partial [Gemmatimonadales bacterium]
FSGRRSFDRQLELLTIAVHTLQRDFAAANERLLGMADRMRELSASMQEIEEQTHKLDKALVTRIATISVAERVLWIVITVLIGVGVTLFGG